MCRERIGQLVFACAFLLALVVYGLTAPIGLPWNDSTQLAVAYLGEILRLPVMPHPVWGHYVQVFGGAVVLSSFMAALGAGLLGVLVNRYFGWRVAASAALVWLFLPGVWNRAITGTREICLVSLVVVAAWVANAVLLCALKKVREMRRAALKNVAATGLNATSAHDVLAKRVKLNRIAGWGVLGGSVVFALASLACHDYRLGEAASVFARGVIEEAAGRTIVMNGVCDRQIVWEARRMARGAEAGRDKTRLPLSMRNDDAYRAELVAWAQGAFPGETNLWMAAKVSPVAFVEVAAKKHPESFYLMGGRSATWKGWEKRWQDFKPYLGSGDPFVRVARRQFAYEANAIANRLADVRYTESGEDGRELAWKLYVRIHKEVEPGNISALVNMNEMIRRGHSASGEEKRIVHEALERFFKDEWNRRHMKEIARASGPIRSDPEVLAKALAEAKRRMAAKIAAGESVEVAPEMLSLVEWNNEMVAAMDRAETVKAGRIARAILSNPKWRGFVPANAVLGAVASAEGDYATSESFFRVAMAATNRVPAVMLNDYADTLMHLHKLDEAESVARRAVSESDEKFWLARLTLAQVLETKLRAKGGDEAVRDELRQVLAALVKTVPKDCRAKVLELQRKAEVK